MPETLVIDVKGLASGAAQQPPQQQGQGRVPPVPPPPGTPPGVGLPPPGEVARWHKMAAEAQAKAVSDLAGKSHPLPQMTPQVEAPVPAFAHGPSPLSGAPAPDGPIPYWSPERVAAEEQARTGARMAEAAREEARERAQAATPGLPAFAHAPQAGPGIDPFAPPPSPLTPIPAPTAAPAPQAKPAEGGGGGVMGAIGSAASTVGGWAGMAAVGLFNTAVTATAKGLEALNKSIVPIASLDPGGLADAMAELGGPVIGGVIGQFKALTDAISGTARRLSDYHAGLATAEAMNEFRQTVGDMRRAQKLGADLARFETAKSSLSQTVQDRMAEILGKMLPMLTDMIGKLEPFLDSMLSGVSGIMGGINIGYFGLERQYNVLANLVGLATGMDISLKKMADRDPAGDADALVRDLFEGGFGFKPRPMFDAGGPLPPRRRGVAPPVPGGPI